LGEQNKATIYENQDYLFFILTPAKTRTFKNEKTALELAEKIQERLFDHNRRFNEKIKFGISLDYGTIVGKIENGIFKFMSMGPLVTSARKIASLSNEKILLSEKMNELLRLIAKTEKETKDGTNVYTITKIKKENEEARKFIDKFMSRQKGN
jgi:class 3 adenylate cyclase